VCYVSVHGRYWCHIDRLFVHRQFMASAAI
jgi:hypothetical protein